jgi:uncharacterized membrane protein YqjE
MSDKSSDTSASPAGPAERLLQLGGRLLSNLVESGHTRVDLLSLELAIERGRFVRLLLLLAVLLASSVLAAIFISALVIICFWDSNRLLAAGAVAGFYLVIAATAGIILGMRLRDRRRPFAHSIETLRRDLDHLRGNLQPGGLSGDDLNSEPMMPGDRQDRDQ